VNNSGLIICIVGCVNEQNSDGVDKVFSEITTPQVSQSSRFTATKLQPFSLYLKNHSGIFSSNGDITVFLNEVELGTIADGETHCYQMYIDPGNYNLMVKEQGRLRSADTNIIVPDFSDGIFDAAVIAYYEKGKIEWISNDNPKYQSPYVSDGGIYSIILPGTEDEVNKMWNENVEDDVDIENPIDDQTPVYSGQFLIEHDETAQDLLGEKNSDSNSGIHQYEYVVADCSWFEAYEGAINSGGYLINMDSDEEIEYIINELNNRGLNEVCFYIGGRRNELGDDTGYHWVNSQGEFVGERLDSDKYLNGQYWLSGEPSYSSNGINECYMNLIYREAEEKWYWNDIPENLIDVSDYWSGRVGFIIELE